MPTPMQSDHEALFRPILLYATAIDTMDLALMHDVFTPDSVADYGAGLLHGPTPVIDRMQMVHERLHGSRHRLTNFRVIDGEESAIDGMGGAVVHTVTYVDAFLVGGPSDNPLTYRDIGSYHDRLVAVGDRWLIAHRRYERLYREGDVMRLATWTDPA